MIRITIKTVNKVGPIQFPAKIHTLYVDGRLRMFDKDALSIVDKFMKEHPDRSLYEWNKDVVKSDEVERPDNHYGAKPPTEEPL